MALKESIRKAEKEKNYVRRFTLKYNTNTDADIIEKLLQQDSIQGYIRKCIRADIEREKENQSS